MINTDPPDRTGGTQEPTMSDATKGRFARRPESTKLKWDPLPTWLAAHLDQQGYIDADAKVGRRARSDSCNECRWPVVLGLDNDYGALTSQADPWPITSLAEAMARIAGQVTFRLRWCGNRYELDRRDQWRIKGEPADAEGIEVLVAHVCDGPKYERKVLSPKALADRAARMTPVRGTSTDDPPF